jgi:hypothetical protein
MVILKLKHRAVLWCAASKRITEEHKMAITTFRRYEMKFMLSQTEFDMLIPRLLEYMDSDDHCQNGKEYSIYNIYYDTQDNHLIRHSLSKPYYKEKLRLRSYTIPTSLEDKVFLELKRKLAESLTNGV